MCFTPTISLTTALLEFFTGGYLFFKAKRIFALKLLVLFIFLLGAYQFSEFMLCKTDQLQFWSRFGFVSYNFLPAVGLHFVISYSKKKFPNVLLYLPPIIAAIVAIFAQDFIVSAACNRFFVGVETLFFRDVGSLATTLLYWLYYFGYIFVSAVILFRTMNSKAPKPRRTAAKFILLAVIISLLPAYLLVVFIPSWGYMFPSIYCEFALLFALLALIGVRRSSEFKK